jgi:hypothetical protein
MVSWVAQESDGLLNVDTAAVWLIALAGVALSVLAGFFATQKPWRSGSMKLSPVLAKTMFVTMIALTAAWLFIGIAHTRTQNAQVLYGVCAALSGWSAWAIFITLRDFEAGPSSA